MFNDIIYYLVMFHVATACTGASLFCFNFSYKVMVFMQQSFDNFEKQNNLNKSSWGCRTRGYKLS